MILVGALMSSLHGIATRRRVYKSGKKEITEWHMAACSDKGKVHILNGRTGVIRQAGMEDQAREDWEPFQAIQAKTKRWPKFTQTPSQD